MLENNVLLPKISKGNQKIKATGKRLGLKIGNFDLPAGHSCPMANECLAMVVKDSDGKKHRVLGDNSKFVCYATKAELSYKDTYNMRHHNFDATKLPGFVQSMTDAIVKGKYRVFRIHSSGDFYTHKYFLNWIQIAQNTPDVIYFGYTKQATFVKELIAMHANGQALNFHLVYSHGGILDNYATKNNLPTCYVVMNESDARSDAPVVCKHDGLSDWENRTDDYECIINGESFSLVVH